jgi:hypothetical protein
MVGLDWMLVEGGLSAEASIGIPAPCWKEPDDEIWKPADYEKEFGNYLSNGLGHQKVEWGGVKGMLVPGRQVWKVKRARVSTAEIKQVVDDGSFQLGGPDQLQQMMMDIGEGFIPQRATGMSVSLDEARSSAAAAAPASASSSSTGFSAAGGFDSMFSMFPGMSMQGFSAVVPPVNPRVQVLNRSTGSAGGNSTTPTKRAAVPSAGVLGESPTSSGQEPGLRGRPKEDLQSRCDKVFAEFEAAESTHTRFFGAEKKVQMKALTRLQDDLAKALDAATEEPHPRSVWPYKVRWCCWGFQILGLGTSIKHLGLKCLRPQLCSVTSSR